MSEEIFLGFTILCLFVLIFALIFNRRSRDYRKTLGWKKKFFWNAGNQFRELKAELGDDAQNMDTIDFCKKCKCMTNFINNKCDLCNYTQTKQKE